MRGATWESQSKFTDSGAAGAVIDELPANLAALGEASSQLVVRRPPREVTLRP